MDHFAGLDVSVKETSICIVDDTGRIVRGSEGSERAQKLCCRFWGTPSTASSGSDWKAGPLSQWLFSALAEAGLASDLLSRRGTWRAVLAGADQQDRPQRCARHGPDDAGRTLSPGACEDATQSEAANAADPSQNCCSPKAIAIDNDLRGTLRNFGLKVGVGGNGEVRGAQSRSLSRTCRI